MVVARPIARTALSIAGAVALTASCADDTAGPVSVTEAPETSGSVGAPERRFPDVLDAVATFDPATGTWAFDVTVSSPYDTPERYADGWRVVGPDGTVYGVHTLAHDHAAEQPFTRRQSGVAIPDGVEAVTIEGRDRANGFGGGTVTIELQTG